MKTLQKYQCEVCGKVYDVQESAVKCEEHHKIPLAITHVQHIPKNMSNVGYPTAITVRMSDGKDVVYSR